MKFYCLDLLLVYMRSVNSRMYIYRCIYIYYVYIYVDKFNEIRSEKCLDGFTENFDKSFRVTIRPKRFAT